MAKYYDIDDIITDEEIAAVIFQKAASGLGIDPSSETDCADILLRGYFWWNSLCALQVPNQVFPKGGWIGPVLATDICKVVHTVNHH
nr:uncharacterized protein LOC112011950 isoform X2 [Quercus suber]XP_023900065.1 uncharacterized protein LOC112011950 isoform X2 [Quercus suber]